MNENDLSKKSPDRSSDLELAGEGGVLVHENPAATAWKLNLENLHEAKLLQ